MKLGVSGLARTIAFASVLLLACDERDCASAPKTGESTVTEMEQTEQNQQRLAKAQPPPKLQTSQERANLIKRLERLNRDANTTSYIYLISHGNIIAFYTVKGKVSSLNSYLTTPEQVATVGTPNGQWNQFVLPSPDFDGSYGKNPDGIFFFTTDDVYVEWAGDFLWSDQPIRVYQPVQKVEVTTKAEGK